MHKIIITFSMGILLLTACGRESQQASQNKAQIDLTTEPSPPMMGQSELVIEIQDKDGKAINDAFLEIKGDMSHAGMAPVLAEVNGGGENGRYQVPFQWTMGGNWIITVTATLPDGSTAEEQFDLQVAMGDG